MVPTRSTDELKAELGKLDVSVRAELVRFLLDSLSNEDDLVVEEQWEAELDRRVDERRSGKVRGIPARQAVAEFRLMTGVARSHARPKGTRLTGGTNSRGGSND